MSEGLATPGLREPDNRVRAVASPWHTAVFLVSLGAMSAASVLQHGLLIVHVPGLSPRLSAYATVLAIEWLWTLLVWDGLRRRGLGLGDLIGGAWPGVRAVGRDFLIGLVFMAVIMPLDAGMMWVLNPHAGATVSGVTPTNAVEMAVWVVMAATAGFCEELLLRGFMMRQIEAWTGSRAVAVVGQGVIFGLGHGYYGLGMLAIMVHGCLLGLLATWRKSLRPGMLAHGMQDLMGGIIGFAFR